MEQKLLLTAITVMATVIVVLFKSIVVLFKSIVVLFKSLMSAHRQQIIAKDKEIDFLRQLSLRTKPRQKGD